MPGAPVSAGFLNLIHLCSPNSLGGALPETSTSSENWLMGPWEHCSPGLHGRGTRCLVCPVRGCQGLREGKGRRG